LPHSGDRFWRELLKCSVAKNGTLCILELSIWHYKLWPPYRKFPVMELLFPWNTKDRNMSVKPVIDKLMKIYSLICISKSFKRVYYLHHICPLGIPHLPLGYLLWNVGTSFVEIQVSLMSEKKNGYIVLKTIYIFNHASLSSS
jgi:hypothetical protein